MDIREQADELQEKKKHARSKSEINTISDKMESLAKKENKGAKTLLQLFHKLFEKLDYIET